MAGGRPLVTKREFGLSRTSIKQLAGLLLICGLGEQNCAGLRRYQSICRDVGAGCAAIKAFAAASAQVAPLSKHLPRHRRRLRRYQSICRGIGAGCAALKAFAATSAGVPASLPAFAATSAGVPASLSAFAVASAGVPASLSAFAAASAGVPASLPAFAVASAEKSADRLFAERDCLRRTHVN